MANFYQIYIRPRAGVSNDEIEKQFNLALNWYHFNNNWIVHTTSDAKKWYSRLKPFVENGGSIFIVKIDISDYFGYMNKNLWEWIQKCIDKKN